MSGRSTAPTAIDASALLALADQYGSRQPPPWIEVQEAMERGVGTLMGLEAVLDRVRRGRPAGRDEHRDQAELVHEIDQLRQALTELRAASEHDSTSLAQGFVLPGSRERRIS
jgi:hypothetical protein